MSKAKAHVLPPPRNFRLMAAGQVVTVLGSSLLRFALSLYVLDTTGRADLFAALFALSSVPVLLAPVGGAISDRFNRQRLMVLYDAICCGVTLAFLFIMSSGHASVFVVGAGMVILGVVGAMETPNGTACIPLLVEREKLALMSKEDMMTAYISNRYYADDQQDTVLEELASRLGISSPSIRHEFLTYAYDLLNKTPCHYFDNSVFKQAYDKLNGLLADGATLSINAEILNYFLDGCSAYFQTADLIRDLDSINEGIEVKNRLYRIPTYTTIVEGSLSNLFRCILLLLNQFTNSNYYNLATNKTLSPICEALRSNGFSLVVDAVDVNIRNAINHGGVFFKNDVDKTICFRYKENNQSKVKLDFDGKNGFLV